MLEATAVSVTAGGRAILDAVDLALRPGVVTALIGPNGAGKSTLLKVMAGERRPSSGTVRLHGRDLAEWRPAELARFRSVLAQSIYLAFPFTVREVVDFGLPPGLSRLRGEQLAASALAAVDMAGMRERVMTSLSGGEQQRVHLARVLVQLGGEREGRQARFLLLDEPTASLDLSHQLLVLKLAREHASRGGGALAVLHDLNLAAMAADEIVALDRGRVAARGRPDEVITDALLSKVYGVELRVGAVPAGVFILPQTARLLPG